MTEVEYNHWAPRSRASYAADKIKANGLTRVEAERIANEDFSRLLPDGLQTKDNFLFTGRDENDNVLGYIWFCIRGEEGNKRAFICDVIVEEQYRGKGYGKKMMVLAEKEAKKKGINRIALHVFRFNEPAIRLYQSIGYKITDLMMDKAL